MIPTYRIADDGKSIKCLHCGKTSYDSNDVKNLYCGSCHQFHINPVSLRRTS